MALESDRFETDVTRIASDTLLPSIGRNGVILGSPIDAWIECSANDSSVVCEETALSGYVGSAAPRSVESVDVLDAKQEVDVERFFIARSSSDPFLTFWRSNVSSNWRSILSAIPRVRACTVAVPSQDRVYFAGGEYWDQRSRVRSFTSSIEQIQVKAGETPELSILQNVALSRPLADVGCTLAGDQKTLIWAGGRYAPDGGDEDSLQLISDSVDVLDVDAMLSRSTTMPFKGFGVSVASVGSSVFVAGGIRGEKSSLTVSESKGLNALQPDFVDSVVVLDLVSFQWKTLSIQLSPLSPRIYPFGGVPVHSKAIGFANRFVAFVAGTRANAPNGTIDILDTLTDEFHPHAIDVGVELRSFKLGTVENTMFVVGGAPQFIDDNDAVMAAPVRFVGGIAWKGNKQNSSTSLDLSSTTAAAEAASPGDEEEQAMPLFSPFAAGSSSTLSPAEQGAALPHDEEEAMPFLSLFAEGSSSRIGAIGVTVSAVLCVCCTVVVLAWLVRRRSNRTPGSDESHYSQTFSSASEGKKATDETHYVDTNHHYSQSFDTALANNRERLAAANGSHYTDVNDIALTDAAHYSRSFNATASQRTDADREMAASDMYIAVNDLEGQFEAEFESFAVRDTAADDHEFLLETGGAVGSHHQNEERWQIAFDELTVGKVVGRGAFGVVHKAKWNGTTVALKKMDTSAKLASVLEFNAEIKHMVAVPPHANVLLFYGVTTILPEGTRGLVVEYCRAGALSAALYGTAAVDKTLDWSAAQLLQVAFEAACGVAHLHRHNVIHRDIAARNVLLTSVANRRAKVADFGMARLAAAMDSDGQENVTHQTVGPVKWMVSNIWWLFFFCCCFFFVFICRTFTAADVHRLTLWIPGTGANGALGVLDEVRCVCLWCAAV